MKSFLTLSDIDEEQITGLMGVTQDIKRNPSAYLRCLEGKNLLMIFEKPSLRTRVSFDTAMKSLGGNTVSVGGAELPWGSGKESIEDTAKVSSLYVDAVMARLHSQDDLVKFAQNAAVPVINGMTNEYHPVQVLSDLFTIKDIKGEFGGLKLCYIGDGDNNVTHSLIEGCAYTGINICVGCPKAMSPKLSVVENARTRSQSRIVITQDPVEAIEDADIVYTDSWMSYHIPASEKDKRIALLMPYQVNSGMAKHAKRDYIFMNCLPAMRGYEQTAEIIDGPNSVVYQQAGNRLHAQKALLLWCLRELYA